MSAGKGESVFFPCDSRLRARGLLWIQYHSYAEPDFVFRRLPLPFATVVLTLGGAGRWRFGGGDWQAFPRLALRGAATGWTEGQDAPGARNEYLAALIEPWAIADIVGIPASLVCNQVLDLERHWAPAARLYEAVEVAEGAADKIRIFSRALLQGSGAGQADPRLRSLAEFCRSGTGSARLRDFARDAGCSDRWLRSFFRAHMGVSPKRWSLLERFAASVRELHPSSWGSRDDYVDPDYADEPHRIHEFARHAGMTPRQYARIKSAGDPRVFVVPAVERAGAGWEKMDPGSGPG